MSNLHKGAHVVYSIHLHIVLVTKYLASVFTNAMIEEMKNVFERVLTANKSHLEACEGAPINARRATDRLGQNTPNFSVQTSTKIPTKGYFVPTHRAYYRFQTQKVGVERGLSSKEKIKNTTD